MCEWGSRCATEHTSKHPLAMTNSVSIRFADPRGDGLTAKFARNMIVAPKPRHMPKMPLCATVCLMTSMGPEKCIAPAVGEAAVAVCIDLAPLGAARGIVCLGSGDAADDGFEPAEGGTAASEYCS